MLRVTDMWLALLLRWQYKMFPTERDALEFDDLGATRNVLTTAPSDDPSRAPAAPVDNNELESQRNDASAQGTSRVSAFNVVLVSFLFVRILIPHVVLQPWRVGIGTTSALSRATEANLKSLATMLYHICALLSPLPPLVAHSTAPATRRASVAALASQEQGTNDTDSTPSDTMSFLTLDELSERLNTNFPVDDPSVQRFAHEQQVQASHQIDA